MTRRPLPMVLRVFAAMVLMVVAGSWMFASVLGTYQDRAIAETLAPMWAAAVRGSGPGAGIPVAVGLAVRTGTPPPNADDLEGDPRSETMLHALRDAGIDVRALRLDGRATPPVTWLDQRLPGPDGVPVQRWVGIPGSLQPVDFRERWWMGVLVLVALVLATAWLVSRWVALPLARLSRQVEGIARGEVPAEAVRGVREIEQLGRAVTRMARQREAFDDQRRLMLMGVSHDLRSPLTRIRVAADLLDDPAAARLRSLIVQNVEQADAIIESFSDYVRSDSEPVDGTVDLRVAVQQAASAAALPAQALALPDAPVAARGNAVLLQRLLANLLDNALRHGAQPVGLALSVLAPGEAEIAVDDAGPGIAEPDRMLRPFQRGDAARGRPGSGLGLAIAARIAERHGGSLQIGRSAAGGARVAVRLPCGP